MNNVYMSIYFEDIEEQNKPCGLVFSSQILDDYDISVNAGWRGKEICSIKHGDKQKIKKNKINKIKKFIKNPEKILNKELLKYIKNSIMLHEVLFYENIPLDKYLVRIDNCGYTKEQIEEIKKIIKEKRLNVVLQ